MSRVYNEFTAIAKVAMEAWYERYGGPTFKLQSLEVIELHDGQYVAITKELWDDYNKVARFAYEFDFDRRVLKYIDQI